MLTVLFFGTGVALLKLRQRAMNANECYDFDENELEAATAASLRSCCSSTNSLCSLDGEAGAGEKVGEATAAPDDAVACKFCHEDSTCRFCFGGPEKDQLIAPCLCVGSQEFVHIKCLRQWQKVAMRTKGNKERDCRVCHAPFKVPSGPIKQRLKLWFSFKAKAGPRRSGNLASNLFQLFVMHKMPAAQQVGATKVLARSTSAQELAMMVASTEVRIWAGREVRHGKTGLHIVKMLSSFGSVVNVLARLKAMGVPLKVAGSPLKVAGT